MASTTFTTPFFDFDVEFYNKFSGYGQPPYLQLPSEAQPKIYEPQYTGEQNYEQNYMTPALYDPHYFCKTLPGQVTDYYGSIDTNDEFTQGSSGTQSPLGNEPWNTSSYLSESQDLDYLGFNSPQMSSSVEPLPSSADVYPTIIVPPLDAPATTQADDLIAMSNKATFSAGADIANSSTSSPQLSDVNVYPNVATPPLDTAAILHIQNVPDSSEKPVVSGADIVVLRSRHSAPQDVTEKLLNSEVFKELITTPDIPTTQLVIKVKSVQLVHGDKSWKFHYWQVDGEQQGRRRKAFVCSNPNVPDCKSVMKTCGGMRHHQDSKKHAQPTSCWNCGLEFQTARPDVLKRHLRKNKACREL